MDIYLCVNKGWDAILEIDDIFFIQGTAQNRSIYIHFMIREIFQKSSSNMTFTHQDNTLF